MMTVSLLQFSDLRITIQPESLGFSDTAELLQQPTGWIGQERAEAAARYGLLVKQPGYHLFVLGEHGSGRCSLLQQLLIGMAANQP
ncbi:MAG: ATP-dependent protease, partial [Nitrosomonas sp.]